MIAIITSTIFPNYKNLPQRIKPFTNEERLKQTKLTIKSLIEKGFDNIILVDNSGLTYENIIIESFKNVKVVVTNQFQFKNYGITETLLLLNILSSDYIPENETIFKISGRYTLNSRFTFHSKVKNDFTFRGCNFSLKTGSVSTKAYYVSNKKCFINLLQLALAEMYRYSLRIVGIRSLFDYYQNLINPSSFLEPTVSIEMSIAKVIKYHKLDHLIIPEMGVEGLLGTDKFHVFE